MTSCFWRRAKRAQELAEGRGGGRCAREPGEASRASRRSSETSESRRARCSWRHVAIRGGLSGTGRCQGFEDRTASSEDKLPTPATDAHQLNSQLELIPARPKTSRSGRTLTKAAGWLRKGWMLAAAPSSSTDVAALSGCPRSRAVPRSGSTYDSHDSSSRRVSSSPSKGGDLQVSLLMDALCCLDRAGWRRRPVVLAGDQRVARPCAVLNAPGAATSTLGSPARLTTSPLRRSRRVPSGQQHQASTRIAVPLPLLGPFRSGPRRQVLLRSPAAGSCAW